MHTHSHDTATHPGHGHHHPDDPGSFAAREGMARGRDFESRAFTAGIGGPVGSGKTALVKPFAKGCAPAASSGW